MAKMSGFFLFADWQSTVLLYLALASAALFLMMGADKLRAKKGARRISEKRLFTFALLGGAAGGTLGMFLFRHKTRHWYFRLGFPIIAILQAAAYIFVFYLKSS